jgi:drug/metabolite transporter (DMT)-like permease
MPNRTGLGIVCALAAAGMYGIVPNFARGAFNDGVPPVDSVFFRTSLITVAMAIFAVLRDESLAVPRSAWPSLAAQAGATLIVSVGYLASVQFIPVGLAVTIFFTFPVIIMLTAPLVERRPPGMTQVAIALVAFAGLALALWSGAHDLDWRGIVLAALASGACAMQFFSGRWLSRHLPPAAFASLVHLTIWPGTLVTALYVGGGKIAIFPGGDASFGGLAYMLGVGSIYVVAYFIHMLSVRMAPASVVAPFYNLEPMVATLFAITLLGEKLTPLHLVGGLLMLAALIAAGVVDLPQKEEA